MARRTTKDDAAELAELNAKLEALQRHRTKPSARR
jgi:hypothetical protein